MDDDLVTALRDEAQASKDVIAVLRNQVEELQREKETLYEPLGFFSAIFVAFLSISDHFK